MSQQERQLLMEVVQSGCPNKALVVLLGLGQVLSTSKPLTSYFVPIIMLSTRALRCGWHVLGTFRNESAAKSHH